MNGQPAGEEAVVSLVAAGSGDTIWTADRRLDRVSTFGGTGEFIRSVSLESFEGRNPSPPTGVFPDGSLFAVVAIPPPDHPKPDPVQVLADYVRYDPTGLPFGSVARAPLSDHFVQAISPQYGGIANWPLAFGRTTTARVYGDRVFLGEGATYEIRVLDTAGGVREVIRVTRDPLPVTERDIQAYGEALVAAAGNDNFRRMMERLIADMPFPTHMPAYAGFLVDAGGGLWVEEYNRPGDEIARWSVFQRDGVWMGTLVFPLRFEPLDIGDDYLLGLWRDADDVEHVQMYRLIKAVQ